MRYFISWNENEAAKPSYNVRSLVKAFDEVYGVEEFVIFSKNTFVLGSSWLSETNNDRSYDIQFYRMLRAYLTPRQVLKVTKLLTKSKKEFLKNVYFKK